MAGKLAGRVAVVTGASRGIGRAAALGLAREGAHVVAVARTVGGLEELDDEIKAAGGSATLVPFDLTDFAAIDRLGAAIHQRWGKLDALFANAGMLGPITPVAHIEPRAFDRAFAVNVTANYRLIRSLDVLLRASDAGRALFVTTNTVRAPRPFWGLYTATKAALEAVVLAYAAEIATTNARANIVAPGALRTRMRAEAWPGEDPVTVKPPEAIVPDIVRMLSSDCRDNGTLFDFRTGETTRLGA
jgi:NAD(P)-dependent dehydrogenase (short-subunit alcohol dehydrogenase family)